MRTHWTPIQERNLGQDKHGTPFITITTRRFFGQSLNISWAREDRRISFYHHNYHCHYYYHNQCHQYQFVIFCFSGLQAQSRYLSSDRRSRGRHMWWTCGFGRGVESRCRSSPGWGDCGIFRGKVLQEEARRSNWYSTWKPELQQRGEEISLIPGWGNLLHKG